MLNNKYGCDDNQLRVLPRPLVILWCIQTVIFLSLVYVRTINMYGNVPIAFISALACMCLVTISE